MRCTAWIGLSLLCTLNVATAQPLTPAKPKLYDVHLRYRIRADRDSRILAYRDMTQQLQAKGFVPEERDDADLDQFDPFAETLAGTIPSENAEKILNDPRIQTVILLPAGTNLGAEERISVQIQIANGLGLPEQRLLHQQISVHLAQLGFLENTGYDHKNYTRLRGRLPAAELKVLLKDLRDLPSGWFLAAEPRDRLPAPFRNVLALRLIEVIPGPSEASTPPPANAEPDPTAPRPILLDRQILEKFTPDAKARLDDASQAEQPLRAELVLEYEPSINRWLALRTAIRAITPDVSIEGWLGTVVTIRLEKASELPKFAALPDVFSVRLPRRASQAKPIDAPSGFAESLARLHERGFRGQDVKILVVASEFSGFQPGGTAGLANQVKLLDLTAEQNLNLSPQPMPAGATSGLLSAKFVAAAAPEAELILVRVDPSAAHQLATIARAILNEPFYSEAMQSRAFELNRDADNANARRFAIIDEYQKAFADLSDEERATQRREAAKKAFDASLAEDEQLRQRIARFTDLRLGLQNLAGATVVINTLTWNVGYAQDGLSDLSRMLETKLTMPQTRSLRQPQAQLLPTWVQAAGEAQGSIWAGPFRDADGNGVLEFAPVEQKLNPGRWTQELNFLSKPGAEKLSVLDAGSKLRFTIQWREPQNMDGYIPQDPTFPLQIVLMRQVDPNAKQIASDELEVVARSVAKPVKLLHTKNASAYEQTLDVTLPKDGVYAVRVEGQPSFEYQIPALKETIEIYPRLVVENLESPKDAPVFEVVPAAVGVGMPADCSAVITIGTANSQSGFGPGVTLSQKPDFAGSVSLIGATIGTLKSAGLRGNDLGRTFNLAPGAAFEIPQAWLDSLYRQRTER